MQVQSTSLRANTVKCAAIDIGSNTIRVVVANSTPSGLDILAMDEALVRIGESVNADGAISAQKQDEAITVLSRFKALAEKHGAHLIFAIATEAIRKATNKDEFLAAIQREVRLEVSLIEGDVESALTFYGATYELTDASNQPAYIGVMDLGGGSMEIVLAHNLQIVWHTSVPIGSGLINDHYLQADPPSFEATTAARSFLKKYFQKLRIKSFPPVLLATGGSANTLLHLAQRAFGLHAAQTTLTYDDIVRCEGLLCVLPSEEVAKRYDLDGKRARILVAGVLIIHAFMERFQLAEIDISTHGIREGVLLAYARYGEQWLEQVRRSVKKSAQPSKEPDFTTVEHETFAQAGRRLLLAQAYKMLSWRGDVLKHEDVEAVHKMRVATRRLRAVLDTYESACDPRLFKKIYRFIKSTADILGVARDTDVMIQNLRTRLEQATEKERTGLLWLIQKQEEYRQQHQELLEKFLEKLDSDALLRQIDVCLPKGGFDDGES